MKLGLFSVNMYVCARPEVAVRAAKLAEELGYDSVWAGDHVVVPRPRVAPSLMEPDEPILDPVPALAFLAAHTERIRLGTGVIVLPQRNPLVLAKQLSSLDVLSGGRLIFGMGIGYVEPELKAIGVPMQARGLRALDYLAAMRSLWQDEEPEFHGRFADFEGVDSYPRPVQRPLPVVMAGHVAAAHRRAARHADGWYGFMLRVPEMEQQAASLRAEMERAGRELEITVTPGHLLNAEIVRAYARLGVHRLVVMPRPTVSEAELEEFVRANARFITSDAR